MRLNLTGALNRFPAMSRFSRSLIGQSDLKAETLARTMKGNQFHVMQQPVPMAGGTGGGGIIPPRNIAPASSTPVPLGPGGSGGGLPAVRPGSDIEPAWWSGSSGSNSGPHMKWVGRGEGRTIWSGLPPSSSPGPTAPLALPAGQGAVGTKEGFGWKDWAKMGALGLGGVAVAGVGLGVLTAGSYENQWNQGR